MLLTKEPQSGFSFFFGSFKKTEIVYNNSQELVDFGGYKRVYCQPKTNLDVFSALKINCWRQQETEDISS